ncbi:4-hydroxyphenylpyruvate dioxygenase [Corynebacterium hadale]|uniref:3-dehydroshikimate dehydratase n=1 Tax=Corynebacterium hadale TaxID=2026255 RepID=A0AB36RJV2_9CORY|nr:sugar phosphate isomerase/epimerase and 4-hydroxyphenylpyruvate domain-containing protein [Corynebacterium hadale]PAT09792.1 4-hydroxyphenylpyruvate dioxygenase [Corynebacterium hadale]
MHTSIATVCLSGTLAEKLRAAADAGFDGVEIFEQDLVVSPHTPEQIRQRAADLGVSLDLYQPFRDLLSVSEEQFQDNLRRLETKFQLMNRLGIEQILICSNVATATVDSDEVRVDQLRRAGELGAKYGCTLSYEALAWGKYVNTYRHAYEIVEKVDLPNVGTCLDSFHILSRGNDPSFIAEMDPSKIFFLQLADAPRMDMGILSWSRHHRVFPGEGDLDLVGFMACVAQSGYEGPVSLEIFNDSFREAEVARTAVDGLRSLKWIADNTARVIDVPNLPMIHDSLAPAGYDYLELETGCLGDTVRVLHQLGFQLGGFHQTKTDIQLWTQGDARIVVRDLGATGAPTELVGMGIIVDDPKSAAARAGELAAQRVPRETADDEVDLFGVYTPDGTELSFCASGRNRRGATWMKEFGFDGNRDVAESGPLIIGIDHVALAQPAHSMAETRLYYHSVLGLDPLEPEFVPSPAGLVHKQAMVSENVSLTVSVAPATSEQGEFLAPAYPEHVTLATHDVLEVARRARKRGLEILEIPDNYYDDLAARFGLCSEVLDQFRELNICYDRDGSGEYLHFYTAPLGKTFFEVSERRDGYKGYGWADEPVRLAAQYRLLRDHVRGIPR